MFFFFSGLPEKKDNSEISPHFFGMHAELFLGGKLQIIALILKSSEKKYFVLQKELKELENIHKNTEPRNKNENSW